MRYWLGLSLGRSGSDGVWVMGASVPGFTDRHCGALVCYRGFVAFSVGPPAGHWLSWVVGKGPGCFPVLAESSGVAGDTLGIRISCG